MTRGITRREFLILGAAGAASLLVPGCEFFTPEIAADEARKFKLLNINDIESSKDINGYPVAEYKDPSNGEVIPWSEFKKSTENKFTFDGHRLYTYLSEKPTARLWGDNNYTVEIRNSRSDREGGVDFLVEKSSNGKVQEKMSNFSDFTTYGLGPLPILTLDNDRFAFIGLGKNLFVLDRLNGNFRRERIFTPVLSPEELNKVRVENYDQFKPEAETSIRNIAVAKNLLEVTTRTPIDSITYNAGGDPNVAPKTWVIYGSVSYLFKTG